MLEDGGELGGFHFAEEEEGAFFVFPAGDGPSGALALAAVLAGAGEVGEVAGDVGPAEDEEVDDGGLVVFAEADEGGGFLAEIEFFAADAGGILEALGEGIGGGELVGGEELEEVFLAGIAPVELHAGIGEEVDGLVLD